MAANISHVVSNHSGADPGHRFVLDFFPLFCGNGGCVSDRGDGGEFVVPESLESLIESDDEEFFGTVVPIATTRKHEK